MRKFGFKIFSTNLETAPQLIKECSDFATAQSDVFIELMVVASSTENDFNMIKSQNCKVGISVKPNTKVEEVYKFLPYVHMCLIMTVEPGKGGQTLLSDMLKKISTLKKYIEALLFLLVGNQLVKMKPNFLGDPSQVKTCTGCLVY